MTAMSVPNDMLNLLSGGRDSLEAINETTADLSDTPP
jgi:hypothetical protein